MPIRHFLAAVVAIVASANAASAVELTLTDADHALDDIRVSDSGVSVTVADRPSSRNLGRIDALPAEQNVVAYPDLTRQGRKPRPQPQLPRP